MKILVYLKENTKPIVFTSSEDKKCLIDKFTTFLKTSDSTLELDNGDVFLCRNKSDIKCVLFTPSMEKDND